MEANLGESGLPSRSRGGIDALVVAGAQGFESVALPDEAREEDKARFSPSQPGEVLQSTLMTSCLTTLVGLGRSHCVGAGCLLTGGGEAALLRLGERSGWRSGDRRSGDRSR